MWFNSIWLHWVILLLYSSFLPTPPCCSQYLAWKCKNASWEAKELLQNPSWPSWIKLVPFQPWSLLKWRTFGFRLLFTQPQIKGNQMNLSQNILIVNSFEDMIYCMFWVFPSWNPKFDFLRGLTGGDSSLPLNLNAPRTNISFQCEEMDILCWYFWTIYSWRVIDILRAI